jgi:glycoside/pentoside/hexuronide:cation symporter, GPH family
MKAGLTGLRLVNYSLPVIAIEFVIYPTLAVLPSFYLNLSGGELAQYATAMFISRLVYSCSGPVVGYLSDRFTTPWGRRRPWMVAGTVVECVSVAFLFMPPVHAGPTYFAWTSAIALFGFSMIDVPYIAWGSEITRDYNTRSRVTAYRAAFAIFGEVIFLGLPLIPMFGGKNFLAATTIARLGVVAIVLLLITMTLALFHGPEAEAEEHAPAQTSLPRLVLDVLGNKPMWFLTGTTVLTVLPSMVQTTVLLQFMSSLGHPSAFSILNLAALCISIAAMPFWLRLTNRIGKPKTWTIALAITFASIPLYAVLAPIAGPFVALVASTLVTWLPSAHTIASLPYAVMGDVIDYDELKHRSNRSANYSAIVLLIIRLQSAIGGALAFYILATMHFDAHAVNERTAQPAMLVAYFAVPGVFLLLGMLCAWRFPIDARKAGIVRSRLEKRHDAGALVFAVAREGQSADDSRP